MVETAQRQRAHATEAWPLQGRPVRLVQRPAVALTILLCIAFALRLYRLDGGLWFDEIQSYLAYGPMSFGEIVTTYDSQNQHLLYSLLGRASLAVFGDSGWAYRLPAVLFGVGSVAGVYALGTALGRRREGLIAAALMTFSYHHIWFSQNARGYTGLLCWTLFSSYFLIRALEQQRPALWIGYAASVALGVFTHMTMLFVVAAQFAVFAWNWYADRHRERAISPESASSTGSCWRQPSRSYCTLSCWHRSSGNSRRGDTT